MKTLARQRDRSELLQRLRHISPQSARRWGRMSAHQMVCHLSDAFEMANGRKAVSSSASFLERTVIKWTALYLPVHWPTGVLTRPEIDQEIGGTKPAAFAADVAQLEALVEFFAMHAKEATCRPHPIFGKLSESAWLRWGYLHMDHHLRQFGQ